jgi:formylglycine-generating enzyme required for sulfatase activity
MTLVGGGTFRCGADRESASLPAFGIDAFPTTNADYARFVAATGRTPPRQWGETGRSPSGPADHPVVFVTWRDAWATKALPITRAVVRS